MKISAIIFKVIEKTSFHTKNYKRQISVSNVGVVKVPVFFIFSDDAVYCAKFHENIFHCFIAIQWT